MKYEYVTSDKLKKSLKKKNQDIFENQLRIMALGVSNSFKFNAQDDKEVIIEFAVQEALNASKSYEDDGNSAFIYFSDIIKKSVTKHSTPVNSEKNKKWSF